MTAADDEWRIMVYTRALGASRSWKDVNTAQVATSVLRILLPEHCP
jgi:hypothetical protein